MSERLILNKNQSDINILLDQSQRFSGPPLLQTTPQTHYINEFVTPVNNMGIGVEGRFGYGSHAPNLYEREHWWIPMDHCYARPWNWRPESTFLRPTKTLFMSKQATVRRTAGNPLALVHNADEVDVESVPDEPVPIYDKVKAKSLMEECEKHAALARVDDGNDEWEAMVSRINWTTTQNRLFEAIVKILNNDYLARLTYADSPNEAVCRRATIEKSVERLRKLMATVAWDPKYTQWLHQLLIDHLSKPYLSVYLDILQTLRSKLPTFVDKMMSASSSSKLSMLSYESLFPLLKRPWDPIALSLIQDKPKKLPGNPVFVVVPSTPISSKRMLKWINLLSNLATVVTIPSGYGGTAAHKLTMISCVDQMFVMTRNELQDIRMEYAGRNIILVGFGFGATLALQIAQVEQVLCTVCLGFSLFTAEGRRGEPDDNLLELQCPVLFVVGQCANTSLQEDMEDLRERMRVETGLVVVGSADDSLRISKRTEKANGITQSIVDRCIIDEIGEFVSGIILSPYPPQIRQSPTNLTIDSAVNKKLKAERKRYNSNASSVDSEPPSPTPRISRPVGRPPGSKSKAKLEAKWAAQARAMSLQNRSLSSLLQGDSQSIIQSQTPKTNPGGIKVLENVKLTGGTNPKFISSSGKMIDMSKISVINTKPTSSNSIVLFPDGKIRNLNATVKTASPGGRYITSKRQLIGNKPPKPIKKISYIPQPCSLQTNLPPPTNLTTQDIMDLPIIFADDNQILDTSLTQPEIKPAPQIITPQPSKIISTTTGNKFMLVNKQSNFIISPNNQAKTINTTQTGKTTPKYTKIILSSKRTPSEDAKVMNTNIFTKIRNLSPEISVKEVSSTETTSSEMKIEEFDLENEIAASKLYKPSTVGSGKAEESNTSEGPVECSEELGDKATLQVATPVKRSAENIEPESECTPSKVTKLD